MMGVTGVQFDLDEKKETTSGRERGKHGDY